MLYLFVLIVCTATAYNVGSVAPFAPYGQYFVTFVGLAIAILINGFVSTFKK